jgi:Protein of unknown function (DUF642)
MKKYLLLAALLSPSLANANLIINGSFEDTIQADGTWDIYAAVNGWTATNGIEIRNNVVGTASDGKNFVELDARENSSLSQTISTISGSAYQLLFDYAGRIGQSADENALEVYWNGDLISPIAQAGGTNNNLWTPFIFPLIGTGKDKLTFVPKGPSNGLGPNIDNVDVSLLTAVPAPAAIWLFGSAIGLFGMSRRKSI